MSNIVTCDDCFAEFKLPKPRRKTHKGLIYEYYFHCPDCEHKYISYYTNKKIRRDINRQKKRWQRYRRASTEDDERRRLAEIKMQDKLIKKDMDKLFDQMNQGVM